MKTNLNTIKTLIIAVLLVIIIVFFLNFYGFFDEPDMGDISPGNIRKHVTFYNNGCCFYLNNIDLKLVLSDASEIPLMYNIEPPYQTKQIAILPDKVEVDGPVKIIVSFRYEYQTKGDVSFVAMEYANYDNLRDNGIYFCFGDGDLVVQSGIARALFRDNGISSWIAD